MAGIVDARTGQRRVLISGMIVGRRKGADVLLDRPFVSQDHASFQWTGQQWELRDLGSANGTMVDGRNLAAGERAALFRGSAIEFGGAEARFLVDDDGPPSAVAVRASDGCQLAADGEVLGLPDDEDPVVSIYRSGPEGEWLVEDRAGQTKRVRTKERLAVGDEVYRLELPTLDEATPLAGLVPTLDRLELRLLGAQKVPSLSFAGSALLLEERWFTPLLIFLARRRQQDRALPIDEQGWIQAAELAMALGLDPAVLNVAVHKLRQQLAKLGVQGAAGVVEVRKGARRLGIARIRGEGAD